MRTLRFLQLNNKMKKNISISIYLILSIIAFVGMYKLFYVFIDSRPLRDITRYPSSSNWTVSHINDFIKGNSTIVIEFNTQDSDAEILRYYNEELKKRGWHEQSLFGAISTFHLLHNTERAGIYINPLMLAKNMDDIEYVFSNFKRDKKYNLKVQFSITYQFRQYSL